MVIKSFFCKTLKKLYHTCPWSFSHPKNYHCWERESESETE